MKQIQVMGAALAIAVLTGAGWQSIRLARADFAFRQGTPEAVARAVAIAPDSAAYLRLAALQAEYDFEDPGPMLRRIAELNPRAGAPRLQLGLNAEVGGDPEEAERWLMEAYSVDRMFETRWALANFYFRQSRAEAFWMWVRSALEISYGDRRPVFDLCWSMSEDGAEILEQAIPANRTSAAAYLWYLIGEQSQDPAKLEALTAAALRLRELYEGERDDSPYDDPAPLLAASDALLHANRVPDARLVWDQIGFGDAADAENFNSSFAREPVGIGFDWRPLTAEGVTQLHLDAARDGQNGQRIRLSGDHPEQVDLLRQMIALSPRSRYRLHWEVATRDLTPPAGLTWSIAGVRVDVETSGPTGSVEGELEFEAPDGEGSSVAVDLVLSYRRPSGQVRTAGSIDVLLSEVLLAEDRAE